MIKEKMIGMSKEKEYKRWRKSVEKDGVSKSISVEECENGFVIKICKDNYEEGKYKTKTYISTKNPLESEEEYSEEIEIKDEILSAIKALND